MDYTNLEIEEERSSESSSRSGDVSDLFAESEDTTERLNVIDEVRDFSGVLTMAPSGVSVVIVIINYKNHDKSSLISF